MRIVEIERCNPYCTHNAMLSLSRVYCQHPKVTKRCAKRIPYSKITDKHPFPDWCPLEEKDDIHNSVCPKCGYEDVIWTCYCNQCNESM